MPGIARIRPDYKPVRSVFIDQDGAHSGTGNEKAPARYCDRCKNEFQVDSLLGPRIMPPDRNTGKPVAKPPDYDSWLECYNCGTIYAVHETKREAELSGLTEPDSDPSDRAKGIVVGIGKRRKIDKTGKTQLQRRRKQEIDDIADPSLRAELKKPGTKLVSYSESRG